MKPMNDVANPDPVAAPAVVPHPGLALEGINAATQFGGTPIPTYTAPISRMPVPTSPTLYGPPIVADQNPTPITPIQWREQNSARRDIWQENNRERRDAWQEQNRDRREAGDGAWANATPEERQAHHEQRLAQINAQGGTPPAWAPAWGLNGGNPQSNAHPAFANHVPMMLHPDLASAIMQHPQYSQYAMHQHHYHNPHGIVPVTAPTTGTGGATKAG